MFKWKDQIKFNSMEYQFCGIVLFIEKARKKDDQII